MDSRLLNVFHEDPFDGNFAKFETEPSFWSPNDDLQLTDTLNGILPIAPTDAHSLLGHDDDNVGEVELQSSKNLLIYSDFVEQQLSDQEANVLNAHVYQALTDGEVEVAYQQHERHLSAVVQYDDPDGVGLGGGLIEEDVQSQCSNSTFRTRTDSSSIGDYESHSSDYDDDDEEEENKEQVAQNSSLLRDDVDALDDYYSDRKSRTLSTNTIVSEVDALGLNIDVNNFDLADFITKDDFAENISACRVTKSQQRVQETALHTHSKVASVVPPPSTPLAGAVAVAGAVAPVVRKPTVASAKQRDSEDDDSDSIIDVETVDVVDVDETIWATGQLEKGEAAPAEDLCYVDNVKADPSWSPKGSAKKPVVITKEQQPKLAPMENPENQARGATAVTKPKTTNNICLVPNKKQSEFLKRKVGAAASKSNKPAAKKSQEGMKSAVGSKQQPAASTGLGLGGKNLALLKHERDAAAASVPAAPATGNLTSTQAPKRKLNLEEYKQRRCGGVITVVSKTSTKAKPTPPKQPKLDQQSSSPSPAVAAVGALKPMPVSSTSNHQQKTAAIANIVNSLKCPPIKGGATEALPMDPITVAKNKVLRMLEMKRAQQLKIIDSRVSAKVPRVTKLPPLKDIVKDTYRVELEEENSEATATATTPSKNKLRPDLDALIIVSASCNTDITIPPNQLSKASPRSLLKSSVLLYNISNGKDANKNMSNSLIASIQSEVVRQTSSTAMATLLPKNMADGNDGNRVKPSGGTEKNAPHGEDMVIMHLPKNRERKTLVSMATQTDLQPEFPLLVLPASTRQSRERSRRTYRKRRATGSDESSSSSGSSSDCSSLVSYRSRSRSRSRSHSTERLRSLDATATCGGSSIGNGGYSSRSTHRHRSSVSSSSYSEAGKYERRQRRTSYNKRRSKNQQSNWAGYSSSGSEISDRERSRSRSPQRPLRRSRSRSQSEARFENSNSNNNRRGFVDRNVSQPAVEERRIVYVGRIEQETTKELLRRKFLAYGSIKQITIHYKENGMKYGFVTYERAQDAFTAIDTSPRDPQINMYDISFGGRRAFCRASYADLDNAGINNYHSYVFPKEAPAPKPQEDSFEALLLKVKAKLNAGKPETTAPTPPPATAVAAPATPEQDHNQI
ncbi:serine/arginine repetitive matrix protein 2 [Drosophila obscura]|uniref:serine/arginine repetitive matrix protein 2 n=1 Tax=Drosophila obscura TaxID=7282 RepID=UPI000BA093EB|nr:serine/arginine repetitive matrix protein 2 [Drosophila obscura]